MTKPHASDQLTTITPTPKNPDRAWDLHAARPWSSAVQASPLISGQKEFDAVVTILRTVLDETGRSL